MMLLLINLGRMRWCGCSAPMGARLATGMHHDTLDFQMPNTHIGV
jgi:hypothetical protein